MPSLNPENEALIFQQIEIDHYVGRFKVLIQENERQYN